MPAFPASERRRHERHPGGGSHLSIDGHPARLIDWSFGGIGANLQDDGDLPAMHQAVDILIDDQDSGDRRTIGGHVQWVDGVDRSVGIVFNDDGGASVELLLKVLGRRLR